MSATAVHVATLRRMIAEANERVYSYATLAALIEQRPVVDGDGRFPFESTWVATYDLYAVAADIWMEKAAAISDSGRAQEVIQMMRLSRRYRSQKRAGSWSVLLVDGEEDEESV